MLKKGQRVEELTKKTGQRPRTGTVIDVRDGNVEVEWDNGHVTSITGGFLRPIAKASKKT